MPGALVLVVGDLSVDVRATALVASRLQPLAQGGDTTIYAETGLRIGGSAWQFAQAVVAGARADPVVFAAVGDDPAGAIVVDALRRAALRLDGVTEVKGAATSVSSLAYFEDRQRLMVFPARHANQQLSAARTAAVLASLPPASVSCAWISGHALLGAGPRQAATAAICDWARRHDVPVVFDLVPHDFATLVGNLTAVEHRIGPVDGVVGEYDTFLGLGYPPSSSTIADQVAQGRRFAIVQHRNGSNSYVQAVAAGGRVRLVEHDISERELQGVGDALAVEALVDVGLLAAASRH